MLSSQHTVDKASAIPSLVRASQFAGLCFHLPSSSFAVETPHRVHSSPPVDFCFPGQACATYLLTCALKKLD